MDPWTACIVSVAEEGVPGWQQHTSSTPARHTLLAACRAAVAYRNCWTASSDIINHIHANKPVQLPAPHPHMAVQPAHPSKLAAITAAFVRNIC